MAAVTMCRGAFAAFATIAAMIVNPAAMAVEVPPCDAAIYLLRPIVTVHMPQLLMTQPELATLSFAARPTQRRKTEGGPNKCLNQPFVNSTSTGAFHHETI